MRAKIYGKQSTYPKKVIAVTRTFENLYYFLAGVSFCWTLYIIVSLMDSFSLGSVVAAILAFIILFAPVYFVIRKILGIFRKTEASFIKGSKGEGRVYFELQKLPGSFSIRQNFVMDERGNIDFVVIGKHKIFSVEVKSHSGVIGFDGERLVRDGEFFEKEILKQARSQAFSVSNHILKNTNKEIWVEPVVVFTGTTKLHFGKKKIGGVFVIGISWLNDLLQEKDVGQEELSDQIKNLFIE